VEAADVVDWHSVFGSDVHDPESTMHGAELLTPALGQLTLVALLELLRGAVSFLGLRSLSLRHQQLCDRGTRVLVDSLLEDSDFGLAQLDIAHNSVTDDGAQMLAQIVRRQTQHVHGQYCCVTCGASVETVESKFCFNCGEKGTFKPKRSTLEPQGLQLAELSLMFNELGDRGIGALVEAQEHCREQGGEPPAIFLQFNRPSGNVRWDMLDVPPKSMTTEDTDEAKEEVCYTAISTRVPSSLGKDLQAAGSRLRSPAMLQTMVCLTVPTSGPGGEGHRAGKEKDAARCLSLQRMLEALCKCARGLASDGNEKEITSEPNNNGMLVCLMLSSSDRHLLRYCIDHLGVGDEDILTCAKHDQVDQVTMHLWEKEIIIVEDLHFDTTFVPLQFLLAVNTGEEANGEHALPVLRQWFLHGLCEELRPKMCVFVNGVVPRPHSLATAAVLLRKRPSVGGVCGQVFRQQAVLSALTVSASFQAAATDALQRPLLHLAGFSCLRYSFCAFRFAAVRANRQVRMESGSDDCAQWSTATELDLVSEGIGEWRCSFMVFKRGYQLCDEPGMSADLRVHSGVNIDSNLSLAAERYKGDLIGTAYCIMEGLRWSCSKGKDEGSCEGSGEAPDSSEQELPRSVAREVCVMAVLLLQLLEALFMALSFAHLQLLMVVALGWTHAGTGVSFLGPQWCTDGIHGGAPAGEPCAETFEYTDAIGPQSPMLDTHDTPNPIKLGDQVIDPMERYGTLYAKLPVAAWCGGYYGNPNPWTEESEWQRMTQGSIEPNSGQKILNANNYSYYKRVRSTPLNLGEEWLKTVTAALVMGPVDDGRGGGIDADFGGGAAAAADGASDGASPARSGFGLPLCNITLSGAPILSPITALMGNFVLLSVDGPNKRPYYGSSGGQYLYSDQSTGFWLVSKNAGEPLKSCKQDRLLVMMVDDQSESPEKITNRWQGVTKDGDLVQLPVQCRACCQNVGARCPALPTQMPTQPPSPPRPAGIDLYRIERWVCQIGPDTDEWIQKSCYPMFEGLGLADLIEGVKNPPIPAESATPHGWCRTVRELPNCFDAQTLMQAYQQFGAAIPCDNKRPIFVLIIAAALTVFTCLLVFFLGHGAGGGIESPNHSGVLTAAAAIFIAETVTIIGAVCLRVSTSGFPAAAEGQGLVACVKANLPWLLVAQALLVLLCTAWAHKIEPVRGISTFLQYLPLQSLAAVMAVMQAQCSLSSPVSSPVGSQQRTSLVLLYLAANISIFAIVGLDDKEETYLALLSVPALAFGFLRLAALLLTSCFPERHC
jgi:hypothetical protein